MVRFCGRQKYNNNRRKSEKSMVANLSIEASSNHSNTPGFRPPWLGSIIARLLVAGVFFGVLPLPAANAALSHDSSLTWKTLHSRHFAVHYHDGEEALARETA